MSDIKEHYQVDKRIAFSTHFSDHFSDNQFCEVVEWTNGEGYDVNFESKQIQITHSEATALMAMLNMCSLHSYNLGKGEE